MLKWKSYFLKKVIAEFSSLEFLQKYQSTLLDLNMLLRYQPLFSASFHVEFCNSDFFFGVLSNFVKLLIQCLHSRN
jgi:hypothetical protein